ncbi:MAG: hypothetical protein R6W82_07340 [bacterium]
MRFLPLPVLLFLALLMPSAHLSAQQARVTTFGDRSRDRGVHIAPLPDGTFAVTGIWQEEGRGDDDVLLAVLEADGRPRWRRAHGGARRDWGWCVIPLEEGGFFVVGTTASSGAGLHDMMLLRADSRGEQLWRKAYGGEAEEYAWSGKLMPDGGVVMAGETTTRSSGERDVFLLRAGPEGDLLWERRWGGEGEDRLFSVAAREDGALLAVGMTTSRGSGEEDALLMTFTPEGEILRAEARGGEGLDVAHHITSLPDGYLVTGYTGEHGSQMHDPWVLLLDGEGEVAGERAVTIPGVNRTLTGCLTSEGYLALTGLSLDAGGTSSVLTVQLDPDGSLRRTGTYAAGENSLGYTVCPVPDGGFAVIGHTASGEGDLQVYFLRYPGGWD